MAFPINPNDGDFYTTELGIIYQYQLLHDRWLLYSRTLIGETGLQGETGLEGLQGGTGLEGAQGETGVQGIQGETGSMNFTEKDNFDPAVIVPELMWNTNDEAFYGFVSTVDKWVQVSSGSLQGAQGVTGGQGNTGVQGETGIIGLDPELNSVTILDDQSGNENKVSAVLYGTGDPPGTTGIPYGTIYLKHEA